jgi:hypothetical protein
MPRTTSEVTVIGSDFHTRLPVHIAAAYAVRRYGPQAVDVEICTTRRNWDSYWQEVQRLIDGGEPSPEDGERVDFMLKAQNLA